MSYDKDNDDMLAVCAFPRRLYAIVNNSENQTIINWTEKGDHFIIFNPNEFAEKILTSREFNSANYASFIRQLNMYDFHKVKNRTREKSDTFYHKYFIKDRPSLLRNIRRKNNNHSIDNDDKPGKSNSIGNVKDNYNFVSYRSSTGNNSLSNYGNFNGVVALPSGNSTYIRNNISSISNNINNNSKDIKEEISINYGLKNTSNTGNSNNALHVYPLTSVNDFCNNADKAVNENKTNNNNNNINKNNNNSGNKPAKKNNKNLIHSLYTGFLKNVSDITSY